VEQKVAQRVEQFRSQKEMVKAQYQVAQAQVNVNEAVTGNSNEMTETNLAMQRAQEKVLTMQVLGPSLFPITHWQRLQALSLAGAVTYVAVPEVLFVLPLPLTNRRRRGPRQHHRSDARLELHAVSARR